MCRGKCAIPPGEWGYWIIYVKSGLVGNTYAPSREAALAAGSMILAFTGIPPQAVFAESIGKRLFPLEDIGEA